MPEQFPQKPTVLIIIPCYNEEEVIDQSLSRLLPICAEFSGHILCVDDGSTDTTWNKIAVWQTKAPVYGLKLPQNCGQQEALVAGLKWGLNQYDCFITIDADLQDDPQLMAEMVQKFSSGAEIVAAVRRDRQNDSLFKRATAALFYWLFSDVLLPQHGDYRLLSRRAAGELLKNCGDKPLLRARLKALGLPITPLYFKRQERAAGHSKYSLGKMWGLAWRIWRNIPTTPNIIKYGTLLVIALLFGGLVASRQQQQKELSVLIGRQLLEPQAVTAPLKLPELFDLQGRPWRPVPGDKPILLHFWATWCPNCLNEISTIAALASIEQNNLQVITINVDNNPAALEKFLKEERYSLPLLTAKQFQSSLPNSYLLNKNGVMCYHFSGTKPWTAPHALAQLEFLLQEL